MRYCSGHPDLQFGTRVVAPDEVGGGGGGEQGRGVEGGWGVGVARQVPPIFLMCIRIFFSA